MGCRTLSITLNKFVRIRLGQTAIMTTGEPGPARVSRFLESIWIPQSHPSQDSACCKEEL